MSSETSGWYARLDHECPDRASQIEIWLDSWMEATLNGQPVAAALPIGWPTLPAGLVSNPGGVLDHLLARFEAESDGRSPRGVYATPAKFVDGILNDELQHGRNQRKEPPATLSLAALPPSFRTFARQFNEGIEGHSSVQEHDSEDKDGRTGTGIPLPFADPCVGAGLFAERILRIHAERSLSMEPEIRKADTLRLLEGLQLIDSSEIAVESARRRLLIVLARLDLVDLNGEGDVGEISMSEAEMILESNVRCGDPLRGEWPWNERPRLIVSRPPWLRIKDRFRGHPDGSRMRKDLSKELREFMDPDGKPRFSAIMGNVNRPQRKEQFTTEENYGSRAQLGECLVLPRRQPASVWWLAGSGSSSNQHQRIYRGTNELRTINNFRYNSWKGPRLVRPLPGVGEGAMVYVD